MTKFDSYIFDMDGTLWDAVPSYCEIWNRAIAEFGLARPPVTYREVCDLMGRQLDDIYDVLIGEPAIRADFVRRLEEISAELMPVLGGKLYPGVADTLARLKAGGAKLFMVSNCEAHGLPDFLAFTGLGPVITDTLSFGQTGADKDVNIRTLIDRYGLRAPVYVGDTMGDLVHTHAVGIPFVWAAYGFGKDVKGQDYTINSFSDLLKI